MSHAMILGNLFLVNLAAADVIETIFYRSWFP